MSDVFDGFHICVADRDYLYLATQKHQIAYAYSFLLRGPHCEHYCTDALHLSPRPLHLLAMEIGTRRSRSRRSSFFIHVEMLQGYGVTVDRVPDRLCILVVDMERYRHQAGFDSSVY